MHPALSVIFFTTLSGAGYGLWFLLGALLLRPENAASPAKFLAPMLCGFVLVSVGLLASVGHLGKPLRAWRAFSQWRSSWLSREGVASLLTYVPALGVIGIAATAVWRGEVSAPVALPMLGALLMLGAAITTLCTARIYSSLKTIHAWHNAYVLPVYLLLALYSGALWCWLWAQTPWFAIGVDTDLPLRMLVIVSALLGVTVKMAYWRFIDTDAGPSTPESATGLGAFGKVKSFERPHTEANYLTQEMGFVVARKHAARLRAVALLAGFALPLALILVSAFWPASSRVGAPLALLSASVGVFVERWLFFAQARHTVMLYYGAARA